MIGKFIFQKIPDSYNLQIFFYVKLILFRFGVVRGLGKMVKDCYVIALPKEKEIHPVMLPLDGPGLDADR